jgi:hypothetical protein
VVADESAGKEDGACYRCQLEKEVWSSHGFVSGECVGSYRLPDSTSRCKHGVKPPIARWKRRIHIFPAVAPMAR